MYMPRWFGIDREEHMELDLQRIRETDRKIKSQSPDALEAMQRVDSWIFMGYSEKYRNNILKKIKQNIRFDVSWEHLGEVYCGRRKFYEFRKDYLKAVARELYPEKGSEI